MKNDLTRVLDLWKESYSDQLDTYSPYQTSEEFKRSSELFSSGNSYFYILNFKNFEFQYISPSLKSLTGLDPEDLKLETLLNLTTEDELSVIEQKEKVVLDFMQKCRSKEEVLSYKVIYTYSMKDLSGEIRSMMMQAVVLSVTDKLCPENILSIHTDITPLKALKDDSVTFLHINNGRSYYNISSAHGYFDPAFSTAARNDLKELLTRRELDVIKLLAKGLNAGEISDELNVSFHTVRSHRKNLMQKLNCNNTPELITKCILGGIIGYI